MKRWRGVAAAAGALLSTAAMGVDVLTVVSPETPPLVVAAEGKVHQDAAADLCDYLSRVTGREITPGQGEPRTAVTIHVGPDAFVLEHAPEVETLFADGFVMKHIPVEGQHHIVLSGMRWQSSRWAVEEFLKQCCGVRWLFPGDPVYGEIVPSRPTITVESGFGQKHEPDYLSRAQGTMYYFDKNRRYLRLRPFAWPFGNHELQTIFTAEDYAKHPEWFALFTAPDSDLSRFKPEAAARGLRRRWHWDYGNGWQICLTNPEALQHAVDYARDYFSNKPESPVVSMGHNDGNGWCECDSCQALASSVDPPYTASELYWHWVNQVARQLVKTHPDKRVATIAYGTPAEPPRFPLEKNIAVTVTVFHESHLDLIGKWQAQCSSVNLYSYAYGFCFVGFRHYPHAMHDFLKWGHDTLGAVSHVSEVYGNWSFDGPKYHYMQTLQWDVNADPDQIMRDYCHDWFGAAAGPMEAFWDRIERVYERRAPRRRFVFYECLGWKEGFDEFDQYTLDDVAALDEAIAEAERKAGTEADRFRVARVADAWKYYRTLLLGKLNYADRQDVVAAEAEASSDRALALARDLAALQSQRLAFMRQLRAYPHINPMIAKYGHFSSLLSRVPIFSDMRSILDDLCEQTTRHLMATGGKAGALAFWQEMKGEDPLCGWAQTQIHMIEHPDRPNLLANGDFETGNLTGWQVSGDLSAASGIFRSGRYAAQAKGTGAVKLSQRVPVNPGERYRLTTRGRYPATPAPHTFLFSSDVAFEGGQNYEPNYRRLRTLSPAGGWDTVRATFTVPPGTDAAVISISSSGNPIVFDDLALEKIKDNPIIKPGAVADDFSGNHIDANKWVESPIGSSGSLPVVRDGALVLGDRPTATLVSLSSFDDLLSGVGDARYRLRVHIAKGGVQGQNTSFACGIKTGIEPINISDSGFWFGHDFSVSAGSNDRLRTYCYQDTTFLGGGWYDITQASSEGRDIWYTFYFDKESITIYAGGTGYDETDGALVGTYEHKMTCIASKGPVFLKISGSGVDFHDISLVRPGKAGGEPAGVDPTR